MTIKERFRIIRRDLHLNQEAFGVNVGSNQVGIADIENGRKNISTDTMIVLHKKFLVNLNWLIAGTGNTKYGDDQPNEIKPEAESGSKVMIDMQREMIDAQKDTIEALKNALTTQKTLVEAQKTTIESQKIIIENLETRNADLEKKAEKWR